jgi:flagellar biosynthetic protein FlhB
MAGERTEAPTPRRLDDARKQGNIAKSQDLVSVGVLLIAVIALRMVGPGIWDDLRAIMTEGLGRPADQELTPTVTMGLFRDNATRAVLALVPLFAILTVAGIVLNVGQSGLLLSGAKLKPKLSNVSPASGAKRIFSKEGLVSLGKALGKMGIIAVVVTLTMKGQMAALAGMPAEPVPQAAAHLGKLAFDIAIRAAVVLFFLGAADYAWQRRQWLGRLRMTKDEVRQEMKESDGDPQIKAAIRRRRQSLLNRMIAAVPKADVVVTNPTHYAVALKYDPVSMQAPTVVAKGERLLALRIKEVARKHGVPVLEEPPLARALYAAVPVGQHIPANLFHAVAEVLAWVYALRQKASGRPRTSPQGAH